jgi:hypothetical protein
MVETLRHKLEGRGFDSDEYIQFFNWPNFSSRNMALRSTQPLTDMGTRNLPGGKGWPACKADNLTAICEPIVEKVWEPRYLTTLCAFMVCYRDSFTFTFLIITDADSVHRHGAISICRDLQYM